MWPLQDNNQGVYSGNVPQTAPTVARLTPVETTEENDDLNVCMRSQQKQHKMLSVCSRNQVMSQTLTSTHICMQTDELM